MYFKQCIIFKIQYIYIYKLVQKLEHYFNVCFIMHLPENGRMKGRNM
jgi:hypothetical protein